MSGNASESKMFYLVSEVGVTQIFDTDAHGARTPVSDTSKVVHVATSEEDCRKDMNGYFSKSAEKDPKMTCFFDPGTLESTVSENYGTNPQHIFSGKKYVISPAPSVN